MRIINPNRNVLRMISILYFFILALNSFGQSTDDGVLTIQDVKPGADVFLETISPEDFSSVAVVAHAGSTLQGGGHLIDEMMAKDWPIEFVYAPEHGFRSQADAGAHISDGKDQKTGLLVKSLYGKNRRPDPEDIRSLDAIVFDLQDVGVRFYTYLSTLKYVLEAAAKEGIPVYVLDRPNPNGFYVDGPVLDTAFRSFVGIIPVPIVHGMTLGEMALLIAGEQWIGQADNLDLKIISCEGYDREKTYFPPVSPSPNLPNIRSILLYPHICYFEATSCSVGRGTEQPFELIAHPNWTSYDYAITPVSGPGASAPKHQNTVCYGWNLNSISLDILTSRTEIDWSWWMAAGREFDRWQDWIDRPEFLNLLLGSDQWKMMFEPGGMQKWKQSYQEELSAFKSVRAQYLLYD